MKLKPRILIVEDEILIALSLKAELIREGYAVCGITARGVDAVSMVMNLDPDVVLLDVGLKGNMDGFETAAKIREVKNIALIFISGFLDDNSRGKAAEYRPLACLSKPVSIGQLMTVLQSEE